MTSLNLKKEGSGYDDLAIASAYVDGPNLCIRFSNGQKWTVDLNLYYYSFPAASKLSDRAYAIRMKIESKQIKWPNGFKLSVKSILTHGVLEAGRVA
ncbi:MAG TPA: hypothetical protein DCS07_04100 [Bdellovibrionales bacterium]|nr:MAG: hypothetical protein A2Z97_11900 [Bdellovibrionales bacterium GWB1_52_6]OFZ05337.1 MAG: hypothetical protein A2X97_16450 [Bdellovibrionales bacterium GWA1_52_35]OFZ43326.1 MAG: hypothetical protein A2070_02860 [Bdellovibrionales bacterium GWC1_52_8]HAR41800.1 hypothetical protein [Bdellovibrionales bacterium]HCM39022.1 hypothetical protein [Bdellovibrionales bacterium]